MKTIYGLGVTQVSGRSWHILWFLNSLSSARPLPITGSTGAACHRMHLPLSPPCPFHCPRSSQMHVFTFRSQEWESCFLVLAGTEQGHAISIVYSSFCLEEEYTPSSNLPFKMDRFWITDILRKWHWIFYFTAEKLISTQIFPINSKSSWTKNYSFRNYTKPSVLNSRIYYLVFSKTGFPLDCSKSATGNHFRPYVRKLSLN